MSELPRGLHLTKEGHWKADFVVDGKRHRKHIGSASKMSANQAISQYATFRSEILGIQQPEDIDQDVLGPAELSLLLRKARDRAISKGLQFELTMQDLRELSRRSGGRCAMTGIPFSNNNPTHSRMSPYKASIDRIDSQSGYTANNCRLICAAMNTALMDFGEDVFAILASSYLKQKMESLHSQNQLEKLPPRRRRNKA